MMISTEVISGELVSGGHHRTDLEYVAQYYGLCAEADGKSPATIDLTLSVLHQFVCFLKVNGMPTDIREIQPDHFRAFGLNLQKRQRFASHPYTRPQDGRLSDHTVNGYFRALRAFWSWLVAEGFIQENPFATVKVPKAPSKIVPSLSSGQLVSLINAIDLSHPQGCRDHAIVLLLVDTGMRVSELCGIRLDDIDLGKRLIKICGKGNRERLVPFGIRAHKALLKYLHFHRPEPDTPSIKHLFLTYSGQPMKKRRVEAIIKRCGAKAGINGVRCSPHTLRHTAAVTWIRNGGDVFSLQRILGHSSLDIVRIYVNLAQDDIDTAHQKYSPLDNLDLGPSDTRRKKR